MDNLSFEKLPHAVSAINEKLEKIEQLLANQKNFQKEEEDRLLRPTEAAQFLDMAKATLYSKVSRKEVPFMKRGGQLWFSTKDLSDWIRSGKPQKETISAHTFIKTKGGKK